MIRALIRLLKQVPHYRINENGALVVSVHRLFASEEFRRQLKVLDKIELSRTTWPPIT